jgi:hypothetical protein
MLCAAFGIAAVVASFYLPVAQANQPKFGEREAGKMMSDLASAFERESVGGVLSFCDEDARVAGKRLGEVHRLLQRAFHNIRDAQVELKNLKCSLKADRATIWVDAAVFDRPASQVSGGDEIYSQRMEFLVKRREHKHLGGLFSTYDWKIADVSAPGIPVEAFF